MTVTTISWGGTNLPRTSTYNIEQRFVGTSNRTANATLRVDSFSTKRRITMEWKGLAESDRTTLYNAYTAKAAAANNLITPDNQTISVIAVHNGWRDTEIIHDTAANAFRYDVQIAFDEV